MIAQRPPDTWAERFGLTEAAKNAHCLTFGG